METPAARDRSGEFPSSTFSVHDLLNLVLILIFCGALAHLRWSKIDTLVWGDTPRWLFEAQRVAAGQIPYRDFSWNYPPLAVLLLGWTMGWFGVTFAVAQIFVDVVSFGVVLGAYFLVRILLPRFLLLPVMFCLVAVCGTGLTFFNLFSLLTYVPAVQIGVCGYLIFLVGVLKYISIGTMEAWTWLMVILGAFVAAYSKPETFIATYSTLLLLVVIDRNYWFEKKDFNDWFIHYAKFGLACVTPMLLAYFWIGVVAGFSNVKAGIGGYGLAGDLCPWWPTGLGIFGAASSLGEAAFIVSVLSLICRTQLVARFGRHYYYVFAVGLAGAAVYIVYVFFNNWDLLTGKRSIIEKIWYSGETTFWTSAVLLPVMWSCLVLWFYLVARFFLLRKQKPSFDDFAMIILLAGPVAMSARGWFNWNLETRTAVPGVCYPFFLVLGPYLIWWLLERVGLVSNHDATARNRVGISVVVLLLTYGSLRLVAAYPHLFSNKRYHPLSTLAGDIRLADYETDSEIYRFVVENTAPTDTILDLPYGGGINFAAHRLSPVFETQFQQLSMPERFLLMDLEALGQRRPKVVIADNGPNYGASYGLRANACAFPRLVWAPTGYVDDRILPVVTYIQKNYRVVKVVGRKLLLVPKEAE
jgi:hypothetical protein